MPKYLKRSGNEKTLLKALFLLILHENIPKEETVPMSTPFKRHGHSHFPLADPPSLRQDVDKGSRK